MRENELIQLIDPNDLIGKELTFNRCLNDVKLKVINCFKQKMEIKPLNSRLAALAARVKYNTRLIIIALNVDQAKITEEGRRQLIDFTNNYRKITDFSHINVAKYNKLSIAAFGLFDLFFYNPYNLITYKGIDITSKSSILHNPLSARAELATSYQYTYYNWETYYRSIDYNIKELYKLLLNVVGDEFIRIWYQSIKDVVKDKENFDEHFEKSIIQDFKLDEQKLCDIINNIECDNEIKK